MDAVTTLLDSPTVPSSFTWNLGTMKSEMPEVPSGAPSTRASTRWMTFSERSWSPPEIQHLVPVIL